MSRLTGWVLDRLPRPLDRFRSIKLKIGTLVVASVGAAMVAFTLSLGYPLTATILTAMVVALAVTQVLAHGMTSPLREMTTAAREMARGDYTRRVRTSSRDEVGELARAFNQMAADLAAADQQRRELIANVSHELRTPITALRAVLENLVDGVAEPDPGTLRTALSQTERLARLVAGLLDLSRIDAGVLQLDRDRFLLAELLVEVVAEAEVAAEAVGRVVRFTVTVEPPGAVACADRERVYQVVLNLLDNASRHSPAGGTVAVTGQWEPGTTGGSVSGGADAAASGQIVMEVADSGPGIPPEERQRVFERFTRGRRASGGGSGLGLAIAQWVVELHGGSIGVADRPGPGCVIRVVLPCAAPGSHASGSPPLDGHL